jgi:TP901 family phage tail tape measure protein
MQTINTFRFGVQYVLEMDKALTDLSKVVNFTNEELLSMKDSALELGKELGKSSVEIMRAYAEFGRVTKVKEEIEELARVSTNAPLYGDI